MSLKQIIRNFFPVLLVIFLSACRAQHSNGLQKGKKLPKSGPIPCPVKDC
jgi:hypothetical protein